MIGYYGRMELLPRMIDYEEWAMAEWRPALEHFPDPERANRIYGHILGCWSGWMPLISDWPDKPSTELDWDVDAPALLRLMREAAARPDHYVTFPNRNGDEVEISSHELVHHMLNHGSYHRGHLRGLAEAAGFEEFPETDSVRFFCRAVNP